MTANPKLAQVTKSAAALGLLCTCLNVLTFAVLGPTPYQFGNCFLFLATGAFGTTGALTAVATGVIPVTFLSGDDLYAMRILLLCFVCGAATQRYPRMPLFLACALTWLLVLGPALYFLSENGLIQEHWPIQLIISNALFDTTIACIAGAFLLSPVVWGTITKSNRHISLQSLLTHTITTVSLLIAQGLALAKTDVLSIHQWAFMPGDNSLSVQLPIFFSCLVLPLLISAWLHKIIIEYQSDLLSSELQAHKLPSFSGRASDFWRRKLSFGAGQADSKSLSPPILETNEASIQKLLRQPLEPGAGILVVGAQGTVIYVNDSARALLNIKQNQLVGRTLDSLDIEAGILADLNSLISATLNHGESKQEIRTDSNGSEFRFLGLHSQRIGDSVNPPENGAPLTILITIRNITDKRILNSGILEEQHLESLGLLASGLGHALNNLLTSITGAASCALRSSDLQALHSGLNEILQSADSAAELVGSWLHYAKISNTSNQVNILNKVIEQHLDLLRRAAGEKYTLEYQGCEEPLAVQGNAILLMQVLTSLVLHACASYDTARGTIHLDLEKEELGEEVRQLQAGSRPGSYARLRIRDSGRGMTAEDLNRIFDPANLGHPGRRHWHFGLPTVFAIVKAHNGFLTAESRPERGSTISIYLPLLDTRANQASAPHKPDLQASDNASSTSEPALGKPGARILVVEDEETIRTVVCSMLATLGYQVEVCQDAEAALERCYSESFDLLLTDMVLPHMQGEELLNRVRNFQPATRGLMMTGYGHTRIPENFSFPVLPKPFDLNKLALAINSALGTPS